MSECEHTFYMREAGIQCTKCLLIWESEKANMTHDELLASIIDYGQNGPIDYGQIDLSKALRAVVQLIKEKQDWLDLTLGDIPMTNEQLYRREERWSLLAEFKSAIEKELM